jgi:hypothetical protein
MKNTLPSYPYGEPDQYLGHALLFFEMHGVGEEYSDFDYPEYGGLPTEISDHIGIDEVDYIQHNWTQVKELCK